MPDEIDALDDNQLVLLGAGLQKLIEHIATRIEYAESRRSSFATIAAAIFAANVALLTIVPTTVAYAPLVNAIIAFSATGIALALCLWFVYARQTNFNYPFKQLTKTWKWFYRDALGDDTKFDATIWGGQSSSQRESAEIAFEAQQLLFREQQIPGLSDAKENARQDLAQVYVLHVNERYKNLFLSQLRTILTRGLAICVALFVIALSLSWLLPSLSFAVSRGQYTSASYDTTASWRQTGIERIVGSSTQEVEVLFNVQVQNKTDAELSVGGFELRDVHGLLLPVYGESWLPTNVRIPANSTEEFVGTLWLPRPLGASVERVEIRP